MQLSLFSITDCGLQLLQPPQTPRSIFCIWDAPTLSGLALPVPWPGNSLPAVSWSCHGLTVFASHLSGVTDLNCLTSDVWKLLTAYISSRLLIVSGRRVNLVPVIPSWPEVKVHQIFAECPILTKCQSLLNGRPPSVHLGCIGGQNPTPLASGKAVVVRREKVNLRNRCIIHSFGSMCPGSPRNYHRMGNPEQQPCMLS